MPTNAMKRALVRGETPVGVWINMVRHPAILRLRFASLGAVFASRDSDPTHTASVL